MSFDIITFLFFICYTLFVDVTFFLFIRSFMSSYICQIINMSFDVITFLFFRCYTLFVDVTFFLFIRRCRLDVTHRTQIFTWFQLFKYYVYYNFLENINIRKYSIFSRSSLQSLYLAKVNQNKVKVNSTQKIAHRVWVGRPKLEGQKSRNEAPKYSARGPKTRVPKILVKLLA